MTKTQVKDFIDKNKDSVEIATVNNILSIGSEAMENLYKDKTNFKEIVTMHGVGILLNIHTSRITNERERILYEQQGQGLWEQFYDFLQNEFINESI